MAPIGGDNNVGPSSSHFPDQQPLTSSLTDVTVVSSAQRTREPGQHARQSEVHRRHSPCALAFGRGRRRLSAWILPGVIRHVRPDIDHPGHRARRAVELPGREPDDRLHPATALPITNSALFHSLPTVLRPVGPWQTRGGSPRPASPRDPAAPLVSYSFVSTRPRSSQDASTRDFRMSRPGARCRGCARPVSPGRSPNPLCGSQQPVSWVG